MLLRPEAHERFLDFLVENQRFWERDARSSESDEGLILVDLAHDSPAYLMTNLVLAKYLQRLRGGRLVGFAKRWATPCPNYEFERVEKLASSFLVSSVLDLDDEYGGAAVPDPSWKDEEDALRKALSGRSGANLRQALLRYHGDVCPFLGRIIYNTYLRTELRPSLKSADVGFWKVARGVLSDCLRIERFVSGEKVVAAVSGHYEYAPYAFIAKAATDREGLFLFQSPLTPVSLRRFRSWEEILGGRPDDFVEAYFQWNDLVQRHRKKELDQFRARFFANAAAVRNQGGVAIPRSTWRPASTRSRLKAFFRRRHRPRNVLLFVHALSDSVHSQEQMLFDDFGDWIERTLEFAMSCPDVHFVVKPHPRNEVYDRTGFIGELRRRFAAAPNIVFASTDDGNSELIESAQLVVTVHGTPGYEAVVYGRPCVLAGRARYSDLGFAVEPSGVEEYFRFLGDPQELPSCSPEDQLGAGAFGFFEYRGSRLSSPLVPGYDKAERPEFWAEIIRALRTKTADRDPLFAGLESMLRHGLPFSIEPALEDLWRGEQNLEKQRPSPGVQRASLPSGVGKAAVRVGIRGRTSSSTGSGSEDL